MKAMILAAGIGSRLRPITDTKPKALVEINKIPLLEIVIKRLISFGFDEIIINTYHFADQILNFLNQKINFNIEIEISNESKKLLGTGGGLKKAAWFFDDGNPFLLHNVDVISNIDLNDLISFHIKSGSIATLAVKNRQTSRYLLFDDKKLLCGWENKKTGEKIISRKSKSKLYPMAFSGIHVIDPVIFNFKKMEGSFSIIDFYLQISKEHKISGYEHNDSYWFDVGKKENLAEIEKNESISK
ncbi:MAG: nucleotidyltransferase family protein [Bacteroidales bacterium]|jgi:NDP-sugar pyrophosphorylase family protein|nr:nucleotidyltransferase family protein [Bacteroidales bacterium]MCK4361404.1 nucleotidyltransferase family protein [Bacteroidales bacterium]MCK4406970.1 nucleotidyltransferase family protein [Bacteroidales bacterium]MCK4638420.1 nucleotidyltransferase family protein [Bacteroidales bacterium]